MSWQTVSKTPREFFEHYNPLLKPPSQIANAMIETSQGNIYADYLRECHAFVGLLHYWGAKQLVREGMTKLHSSLEHHPTLELEKAKRYWDFVLSKDDSPWRCALQEGVEVHYWEKNPQKPLYFSLPITAETRSQSFMNVLIATRLPLEKPGCIELFCDALDMGFAPEEALYLSALYRKDGTKGFVKRPMGGEHNAFGNYSINMTWDNTRKCTIDWTKLRDKNPTPDNRRYQKGEDYKSCDMIWSGNPTIDFSKYLVLVEDEKYEGSFPKRFKQITGRTDFGKGTPAYDVKRSLEAILLDRGVLFPRRDAPPLTGGSAST